MCRDIVCTQRTVWPRAALISVQSTLTFPKKKKKKKFKKKIVANCASFTWMLGRRPRRRLLIVANAPSDEMWNRSWMALVARSRDSCSSSMVYLILSESRSFWNFSWSTRKSFSCCQYLKRRNKFFIFYIHTTQEKQAYSSSSRSNAAVSASKWADSFASSMRSCSMAAISASMSFSSCCNWWMFASSVSSWDAFTLIRASVSRNCR